MNWLKRIKGGSGNPAELLTRYSDILLALLVVGIIAMMIIPLPTFILDLLITTNIALAVTLLLVCIYVEGALQISALPSILLIATLFRLGLNVSSTRLILLQADAGQVIHSFGNFVVAGNIIVGAVVFLILTLIQFIVIAKGSERVAEVAARFTLDAMPGKQMAIDADARAGTIDMDQARRLRAGLQRESQLYGSMDGAMKFVKGDAIAGILITLINIIGGLLIGVLQRGMTVSEAATLYSILTIGDGLVSQIPALLTSTAAGIIVTRVASENEGDHLGRDIGQQILAQPRAIAIAAALLALLAVVPGMPTLPFLLLATVSGLIAFQLLRVKRLQAERSTSDEEHPSAEMPLTQSPVPSILLEVGTELTPFIDAGTTDGRFMRELIPGLRDLLYEDLGVMLPGVRVRGAVNAIAPDSYRIRLSGVPMATGSIPSHQLLAMATREELEAQDLEVGDTATTVGITAPLRLIPSTARAALLQAGIEIIDPPTQMALHLSHLLKTYAFEFVGIQETQDLLDGLEQTHPALVHEVVPKMISLQGLAEVMRRLVEEGISIRDLRGILQALAEWTPLEKDPVMLAEYVRSGLSRYISDKYSPDAKTLRALLLDPAIEDAVKDSIQKTDHGSYLAMEPDLSRDIIEAMRRQIANHPSDEPLPAVLTNMEIRRFVRRLLEVDFPDLPVLSFSELTPQLKVQPVARVSV